MKHLSIFKDLGFDKLYVRKILTTMKLIVFLCLLGVLQVSAASSYAQNARISLSFKDETVAGVLEEIENQSEFFFLYNNKLINVDRTIDIEVSKKTISHVLDMIFDDSVERYISDKQIILSPAKQQDKNICTGKVFDAETSMPLPGVSVVVKGTTSGTATDFNGGFSISANKGDVLIISFIGMITQEFMVSDDKAIEIRLKSDAIQIDEVMAVAYGMAKKSSFTGSAEIIKNDVLKTTASNSLSTALLGQVAGVAVSNSSSEAGAGSAIRIRGYGSFTASSSPLYVVDGVANAPVPDNDDIENITILKDASAASLYGSRAANGVIIITTKKGKGDIKFNLKYSGTFSWKSPDEMDMMGTNDYMSHAWRGLYNKERYINKNADGAVQYAHDNLIETIGGQNPYAIKNSDGTYSPLNQPFDDNGILKPEAIKMIDTDWLDEVYRIGETHDYHLSAGKGDENGSMYTSLSYYDQKGIVVGNDYKKATAVLNTESKVNDFITYGFNSNMNYQEGRAYNTSLLADAYMFNPTMTIYQLDENYQPKVDENGNKLYQWDNPISKNHNVFGQLELNPNGYEKKGFFVAPYLKLNPLEGLTIDLKASAEMWAYKYKSFENPLYGSGKDKNGISYRNSNSSKTYYGMAMGTYTKKINKHSFTLKAGFEVEDYEYEMHEGSAKGYQLWENQRELQSGEKPNEVGSNTVQSSLYSYISNLEYGFADKYYLSGSFRRDGSSRFGQDNRFGNFWSVGATWRLSEEGFLKDTDAIDNLKLRASYGLNGNDGIGNYAYQGLFNSGTTYMDKMALIFDRFENSNLGWESNKNLTIAVEFSFFNRFRGVVEYYQRLSSDLLLQKYYPQSSGASSRYENIGEVSNEGIEVSLNYYLFKGSKFSWDTGLTLSHNKNVIEKLVGGQEYWAGQTLRKEGGSLFNLSMREWAGVDPETGGPLWYRDIESENGNIIGKEKVSDWDQGTMYDKGDPSPKIFGAWNNNIKFGNFDFSFQFYYSFGGHAYNDLAGLTHNDGARPLWNLAADAKDAWTEDNKNASQPMYVNGDGSKAWWRSSRFYEKLDYVKLKRVSLSYSFNNSFLEKLSLKDARVFVMGENLMTITNFSGYDPELSFDGTTGASIVPPATSVSFGINVTF